MNTEITINKQELLKILNLLHRQMRLDYDTLYNKNKLIKDIMGKEFAAEILGESSNEVIEHSIYELSDLYKYFPHTITIESIIWSILRVLAIQDEKVQWCFMADGEMDTKLLNLSHNEDLPYAVTIFDWIYFYDDDFETFIDNMYKCLTTKLSDEFSKFKIKFDNKTDIINYINDFPIMLDK